MRSRGNKQHELGVAAAVCRSDSAPAVTVGEGGIEAVSGRVTRDGALADTQVVPKGVT